MHKHCSDLRKIHCNISVLYKVAQWKENVPPFRNTAKYFYPLPVTTITTSTTATTPTPSTPTSCFIITTVTYGIMSLFPKGVSDPYISIYIYLHIISSVFVFFVPVYLKM